MKRLNALTFKQLRTLQAVTEAGSLSFAADILGLTAPAVHSQLKALEQNFGMPLIYREGPRRFRATPEGAALLDAHRTCAAALEKAVLRIDALGRGLTGTVVLGVVSTGKYFAPRLVAMLRDAYPEIEVVLKIGNRKEIIAALSKGSIDLAIMGRPPREPVVEATAIGGHPHVLVVPPGHPLAGKKMVEAVDIFDETFILREPGSGTRIMAMRFLDRLGDGQPYDSIEMESNETIKQSVIAGLGIAILSRHTVTDELKTGRLVEVSAPLLPIQRTWFILHDVKLVHTGAVDTVLDFVKSARGAFLPI